MHLQKVGPQICVSPLTWTVMDLGLPGQRELLLSKASAVVAPLVVFARDTRRAAVLVSVWGANGSLQTCPIARNVGTLGKQPIKGFLQRHGCLSFQEPFIIELFLFTVIAKNCDPYFDWFKICKCIVKNKITKKRENCSTY